MPRGTGNTRCPRKRRPSSGFAGTSRTLSTAHAGPFRPRSTRRSGSGAGVRAGGRRGSGSLGVRARTGTGPTRSSRWEAEGTPPVASLCGVPLAGPPVAAGRFHRSTPRRTTTSTSSPHPAMIRRLRQSRLPPFRTSTSSTTAYGTNSRTRTGTARDVTVPSPNSPLSFPPQQNAFPSVAIPQT